MYSLFLYLHSNLRWLVVGAGVLLFLIAVRGWFNRLPWTPKVSTLERIYTISLDVQFLIGLTLYIWLSPIVQVAFQDFVAAMKDKTVRFWAVEHITLMFLALAVAHGGKVFAKRATSDTIRFKRTTLFIGLSLLLLFIAIPWPFLAVGRPWIRFLIAE